MSVHETVVKQKSGPRRVRTANLVLAKHPLYQLELWAQHLAPPVYLGQPRQRTGCSTQEESNLPACLGAVAPTP